MKKLAPLSSYLNHRQKIAVVGLGYVGLPLAVHLARHFTVIGYDVSGERVAELKAGHDRTLEVPARELKSPRLRFTSSAKALGTCRLIIVAVPTPIDQSKIPDLGAVESATATVGKHLAPESTVVFESTVYPGVTEDFCVPILERESGLKLGRDFSVGYSPERINPGDKVHTLDKIIKIVSASDPKTLELLTGIYGQVVKAGIHRAPSIKVAEAAKVIENTQRDINIALMNELAIIFNRMGIDTTEVLEAAGTKWNFLPFKPGLVGGHCIGVDPSYLTYKAERLGYHPEMILAGRRINDGMGIYIADRTIKMLIRADRQIHNARVAVLGLTFKEDIPDLRNTRVVDIIKELTNYGVEALIHDPVADSEEVYRHLGLHTVPLNKIRNVDAVVLAVAHQAYHDMGIARIAGLCRKGQAQIVDVKGMFKPKEAEKLGIRYWRL